MRHVCLRNPFLPFLLIIPRIQPLPEATASCASLHCRSKTKPSPMHRNKGFGHWVVVSKICYNAVIVLSVVLCDCCKLVNNCRDWDSSSKWVGRVAVSLSAADVHKMWRTATCLFKESIPSILCRNSKHLFLPQAWGSWEPQHAPPALRYGCIMPIPSLQLQKELVICREEGLVIELWSPRFVTMLCSQLCYETAANQRTIVEIEILATVS